jgi:hypothetical protein
MSKIKNYFHDEIEAQALEREERSEPESQIITDIKEGKFYD